MRTPDCRENIQFVDTHISDRNAFELYVPSWLISRIHTLTSSISLLMFCIDQNSLVTLHCHHPATFSIQVSTIGVTGVCNCHVATENYSGFHRLRHEEIEDASAVSVANTCVICLSTQPGTVLTVQCMNCWWTAGDLLIGPGWLTERCKAVTHLSGNLSFYLSVFHTLLFYSPSLTF